MRITATARGRSDNSVMLLVKSRCSPRLHCRMSTRCRAFAFAAPLQRVEWYVLTLWQLSRLSRFSVDVRRGMGGRGQGGAERETLQVRRCCPCHPQLGAAFFDAMLQDVESQRPGFRCSFAPHFPALNLFLMLDIIVFILRLFVYSGLSLCQ